MSKKKLKRMTKEERRIQILQRATKFFAAKGYDKADVEELAKELGIGKGTIYRYFPTKKELFLASVDRGMICLREVIEQVFETESDPLEKVQKAITTCLTFFSEHPEYVELFIQERAYFPEREKGTFFIHREKNIEKLRRIFEELVSKKIFRPISIDPVLDILGDLLYGVIFSNYLAKRKKDPKEQAQIILDLIMKGLLAEKQKSVLPVKKTRKKRNKS